MEEIEFKSTWIRMEERLPSSGTRCMVTDGTSVVIATIILDSSGQTMWMFSGLGSSESTESTFDIQAWMPLPRPPQRIISVNETPKEIPTV